MFWEAKGTYPAKINPSNPMHPGADKLAFDSKRKLSLNAQLVYGIISSQECFHMTSRPYWCPKTMKRQPCWCPKPIFWKLISFLMQTLSFVLMNLYRCWPREWKHSKRVSYERKKWDVKFNTYTKVALYLACKDKISTSFILCSKQQRWTVIWQHPQS